MGHLALIGGVAAFVGLVVVVELAAAVLPLVIILTFVPPQDRAALVELMTATGGSGRSRVGRSVRLAVLARRATRVRDPRESDG